MVPASRSPSAGLKASDLLTLPTEQRRVLQFLMRRGSASLPEIAEALGESAETLSTVLETLHGRGCVALLTAETPGRYHVRWAGARSNDGGIGAPPAP